MGLKLSNDADDQDARAHAGETSVGTGSRQLPSIGKGSADLAAHDGGMPT
jgi:hypothetical protein